MKKILVVLLALTLVFGLAACGGGKSGKTFVMGIDPEYPPFSYIGEDGEYTGFDVEVCRAACEKLGYKLEIFGVNWDEKLVQLDAKECDCVWAGMTLLPSMKEAGYVLSDPYYDSRQVFLVKESSGIKTLEDLAGKDVAVMLGTSGEAVLADDMADAAATFNKLITCESFLKCFTELDGGAVDAVFVDSPVADSYIEGKSGYVVIDDDFGAEQYGIAFRSKDQKLCDKIEEAVQELVKDGTYAKIAADYPEIIDNLVYLK